MTDASWLERAVVVFGAGGMLGHRLVGRLHERAGTGRRSLVAAFDSAALDIRDPAAVKSVLKNTNPGVVINAAAYTNVDGCESNRERAMAVNAEAPGLVAAACREIGALLVHFSTDFVFDGRSSRPYKPDDPAGPLSVYGRSKWEGEQAIRASGCHHLLIRTSWLYGAGGRNFVEAILARAEAGERLRVVTDQIGRPTLTDDLCDGLLRMLDAGADGTIHFANSGQCSWFDFAEAIVAESGRHVPLGAITSEELDRPAKRPAYSVLDLTNYTVCTGQVPPSWPDGLRRYLRDRSRETLHAPRATA